MGIRQREQQLRDEISSALSAKVRSMALQVNGVSWRDGASIDFVITSRSGTRSVGMHVVQSAEAITPGFIDVLLRDDKPIDRLVIVTGSPDTTLHASVGSPSNVIRPVEIIGAAAVGGLVDRLWVELAEGLPLD